MPVAHWHNAGENRVLNILLGATPVDGAWYLGLYKNPTELGESAVLSNLTEVSGFGYARKVLTRGSWVITDDVATYAIQTFLAQGGAWGNVTGYFIGTSASGTSGDLLATEHFDVALNIVDTKGVKIEPRITVA